MLCLPHPTPETPVSEEFVNQILDKCGDLVLLPNAKGETLLHIAAKYGHSNIAKVLVEHKKFIRATNNEKDTALHEAVRHGHIEVVKTLLEKDPEYSYYANNANETPLYLASERQQQQVVNEILNKVTSPAYDGPKNQTALHAAVINQDTGMVMDLLKNEHVRVAVKHADKDGWIPLHYAAKRGNEELTELLLKEDENSAYIQDNKGRTALHIAAYYGVSSHNVEMIIKHYPDCSEIVDKEGRNALHHAVNGRTQDIMGKIMSNLSLSNLYNERDNDGNTPLHCLAAYPHLSWDFSRLKYHGRVDKLALNKNDQTPLDVVFDNLKPSLESIWPQWFEAKGEKRLNIKLENEEAVYSKEAKESHLLVATLIATVSFAAGITLPGGTIQEGDHKGTPILGQRASFKAFIISNALAMVFAISAASIHLSIPLTKSKFKDHFLTQYAHAFTLVALLAMIVAFATGTYVVLGPSPLCIAIITIALSYFCSSRVIGETFIKLGGVKTRVDPNNFSKDNVRIKEALEA
uniref:Ankyrin repeat-containing protein At3g12360 family n=1 Tax=Cajanus cajan TaxID=3821 RepID=A0A151RZE9_CAJCA|nr:Ankyrin repeat-containing protein At3g12360 family [Cajanus cajan]